LDYDTTSKLNLYAIIGIPEYWVADLQHNRLLVHSDPHEDSYQTVREFGRGDVIAPLLLATCKIDVAIFFP
ncbi:MAG TPA: Uma2 family endonuclease, partial [Nitrospira sp.]|nr:Uma2 family endonuclease [Nitrospira sp.]